MSLVEAGTVDGDDQTGIRAELTRPHRQRCDERAAEVGAPCRQGSVEEEDRVGSSSSPRRPGSARGGSLPPRPEPVPPDRDPVNPTAFMRGSLDERTAEFGARTEQQRERAIGQAGGCHCISDGATHQFGRARVCVVRLDHHRATGGQSRRGVAARYRERERKIAGTEYGHRAQRHRSLADVGPGQRGPEPGCAGSIRAPVQLPSRNTSANRRSCPVVRPTSPAMRPSGRPDSRTARATSGALMASRLTAMASRRAHAARRSSRGNRGTPRRRRRTRCRHDRHRRGGSRARVQRWMRGRIRGSPHRFR